MTRQTKRAIASSALVTFLLLPIAVWGELPPLQGNPPPGGGGGGGGSPTGSAGGDLAGSYPNPLVVSVADVALGVLTVPHGGTSSTSLTAHGVLTGQGTSALGTVAPVASGSLLASAGSSADPVMLQLGLVLDQLGPTAGGFLQRTSTAGTWATTVIPTDAAAGTGSLRTLGTSSTQAAAGNDSRLSNARTPTAHASTHTHGGSDAVGTSTPTANAIPYADASGKLTGWVAGMVGDSGSGGTAGLVPVPAAGTAAAGKFLKADGTWAVPPGSIAFNNVDSRAGAVPLLTQTLGIPQRWNSSPIAAGGIMGTDTPSYMCWDGSLMWASPGGSSNHEIYVADMSGIIVGGRIAGEVSTGTLFAPGPMCFDGTALWVANNSTNGSGNYGVTRVLGNGSNFTFYSIGSTAQPWGICYDPFDHLVWVACGNAVKAIGTTTPNIGTVLHSLAVSAGTSGSICLVGQSILPQVWVANQGAGTLTQIDASSATVSNVVTLTGVGINGPYTTVFDGVSVWATGMVSGVGKAFKINPDPATPTVTASYTVTSSGTPWVSGNSNQASYDGTYLWIPGNSLHAVYKLAVATGTVTTLTFGSDAIFSCCFDGSYMWAGDATTPSLIINRVW